MYNALAVQGEPLLTLVMPVYNDDAIVIPTISTLAFTIKYPLRLIVVYDSEDDTTLPVLRQLQCFFHNISLVQSEAKHGVVNAIKTGF